MSTLIVEPDFRFVTDFSKYLIFIILFNFNYLLCE